MPRMMPPASSERTVVSVRMCFLKLVLFIGWSGKQEAGPCLIAQQRPRSGRTLEARRSAPREPVAGGGSWLPAVRWPANRPRCEHGLLAGSHRAIDTGDP